MTDKLTAHSPDAVDTLWATQHEQVLTEQQEVRQDIASTLSACQYV